MKLLHHTRQYYELLWVALLSLTILILIVILIKDDLFKDSVIKDNWTIVYDETASRDDRINALQYLARQEEVLSDIEFSVAKKLFQGLDLSTDTLDINKGVDLKDVYLKGVNLSDANLSDANLGNAYLPQANLKRTRLHDVNLSEANLSEANLSEANLSGANLSGADLSGVNFYGTNLLAANLDNANLSDANLFAVNLTAANFSNTILNEGTVIDYTWIWETTDSEEHPTAYIPVGIPRNWDTALEPDYVCEKSSSIQNTAASKAKIKMMIKKRCKLYVPYVPPVEPQTLQEDY